MEGRKKRGLAETGENTLKRKEEASATVAAAVVIPTVATTHCAVKLLAHGIRLPLFTPCGCWYSAWHLTVPATRR